MIIGRVVNPVSLTFSGSHAVARVQIKRKQTWNTWTYVELMATNKMARLLHTMCKRNDVMYFEAKIVTEKLGSKLVNSFQITYMEKLFESKARVNDETINFLNDLDPRIFEGETNGKNSN